jgi:hypothetical protein
VDKLKFELSLLAPSAWGISLSRTPDLSSPRHLTSLGMGTKRTWAWDLDRDPSKQVRLMDDARV